MFCWFSLNILPVSDHLFDGINQIYIMANYNI